LAPRSGKCAPTLEGTLTVTLRHPADDPRSRQARGKSEPSAVAALDRARAMKAEMETLGINQKQLAERKGLTTTRVSQLLSLLRLPPEVLDHVERLRGKPLGELHLTERALRLKYRP
jgi:hypothetical protein